MAEPQFIPQPGQVDYTHIRYAPVVNTVVTDGKKLLLVRRSPDMRLYPGVWNGISGFLDDQQSIEEKVLEELKQELAMKPERIVNIQRGVPILQESPDYNKTWLIVPMLVTVTGRDYKLNWEAQEAEWFTVDAAKKLDLLPGFKHVLATFF